MRFDDRLATVLAQPVAAGAMANAQFAQLIDLVAQRGDAEHSAAILDAAMDRLHILQGQIAVRSRAASVAGIGKRLRSARLTAFLASDDYAVAGLAMRAAHLHDEEWAVMIPHLPVRARGLLRNRQDLGPQALRALDHLALGDRALPAAIQSAPAIEAPSAAQAPAVQPPRTEIGNIVDRIEAFRKSRSDKAASPPVLELALGDTQPPVVPDTPDSIAFETDSSGTITWVESPAAIGLVGLSLAREQAVEWLDARSRAAIGASRAVRNGHMTLQVPPLLAGDWLIDATPSFDIISGQCRGHHGQLRRMQKPEPVTGPAAGAPRLDQHMHDSLRQIIHELRTPLNVISGFSEIIESQLFGPASFAYRTLAEDIGRDSRALLDQVNDLDSAFRLGPAQDAAGSGPSDGSALMAELVLAHRPAFAAKGARLVHVPAADMPPLAMAQPALHWALDRLLHLFARTAASDDVISLVMVAGHAPTATMQLVAALPKSLAALPADNLFDSAHEFSTPGCDNGLMGAGFTLRMIATLLESWDGGLVRVDDHLVLTFPLAASTQPERILAKA